MNFGTFEARRGGKNIKKLVCLSDLQQRNHLRDSVTLFQTAKIALWASWDVLRDFQ